MGGMGGKESDEINKFYLPVPKTTKEKVFGSLKRTNVRNWSTFYPAPH